MDLTGERQVDLEADIKSGVGRVEVRLPREVGVRVDVKGGLARANVSGLQKESGVYVNDAYGSSDVTVRIDIRAGVGLIELRVVE